MDGISHLNELTLTSGEHAAMIDLLSHSSDINSILCLTLGLSILDLTSIDNDVLSLRSVFKTWLHDCGTDSEHLHLTLPPPPGFGEHPLTLKCDLQERILDPGSFPPLGQHFVSD